MITVALNGGEQWDEINECFIETEPVTIHLEHSLLALSKWEAKYKKPFLNTDQKTDAEMMDYIKFMVIEDDVDPNAFSMISADDVYRISEYLKDSQTATTVNSRVKKHHTKKGETITSELIYYWLVACEIPFTCETWNLNRLMTLIQVCSEKNNPEKMSKKDLAKQNTSLNAARRAKMHSSG